MGIQGAFTNTVLVLMFSVNSYIGSHPTLLNSSSATQFKFKQNNPPFEKELNKINGIKIRTKIVEKILMRISNIKLDNTLLVAL